RRIPAARNAPAPLLLAARGQDPSTHALHHPGRGGGGGAGVPFAAVAAAAHRPQGQMAPLTLFTYHHRSLFYICAAACPGFRAGRCFCFFGQGVEIFVFLWAFFRNGYSKMTA